MPPPCRRSPPPCIPPTVPHRHRITPTCPALHHSCVPQAMAHHHIGMIGPHSSSLTTNMWAPVVDGVELEAVPVAICFHSTESRKILPLLLLLHSAFLPWPPQCRHSNHSRASTILMHITRSPNPSSDRRVPSCGALLPGRSPQGWISCWGGTRTRPPCCVRTIPVHCVCHIYALSH